MELKIIVDFRYESTYNTPSHQLKIVVDLRYDINFIIEPSLANIFEMCP